MSGLVLGEAALQLDDAGLRAAMDRRDARRAADHPYAIEPAPVDV